MSSHKKFGVAVFLSSSVLAACADGPEVSTIEQKETTFFDCADPAQRLTCAPPADAGKKYICHPTDNGYKRLQVPVHSDHTPGVAHPGEALADQVPGASANDAGEALDCDCSPRVCENECTGATPGAACEDDNICTAAGSCSAEGCETGTPLAAGTTCGTRSECDGAGACVEYPNIVVNEAESNGGTPGDWAELYNAGTTPADVSGWRVVDNDVTHVPYTIPAGTIIPPGGTMVVEEAQFGFGLGSNDAVRLFNPNGTLVDTYAWTTHAITTYGRCPNGTGAFRVTTSPTKNGPNDCSIPLKINEIESSGGSPGDWVELYNPSPIPVDASNFVFRDNGNTGTGGVIPAGTIVAPGAYLVLNEITNFSFGLGGADSARLYDNNGNLLDSYTWTTHAAITYGRCPNGTGDFTTTTTSTKGTANDCGVVGPPTASPWPGRNAVVTVDQANTFGTNLSGLFYEASFAGDVLWAVRNGPSTLFKLMWNGTSWVSDTAGDWGAGKQLVYPDGVLTKEPDSEDVTRAELDSSAIYVVTERDNTNNSISRPSILRFDLDQSGAVLTATHEWNLVTDLPAVGPNLGPEGLTWIPDSALVAAGFFDERLGHTYNPAEYANHGTGLFFAGLEANGTIYGYALDHVSGTFARIATFASGDPTSKALAYDRSVGYLWSTCSSGCSNQTSVLAIDTTVGSPTRGRFTLRKQFLRPSSMDNITNEGLAVTPESHCVSGQKPFYWSDDGQTNGHALRTDTIPCGAFITP